MASREVGGPEAASIRRNTRRLVGALVAMTVSPALLLTGAAEARQVPGYPLLNAPCTASPDQQVTEPGTGRTYLLDYPCDLRRGEPVTFILNLHGGGSSGTWQRRYFPAFQQKEAQRLVIASPYSPTRRWSAEDDTYLQNIVTQVVNALGRENVEAFWLVGHSQGGLTSRRLVCTEFFADKVDGFLSLSGGRLGGAAPRSPNAGRPQPTTQSPAPAAAAPTQVPEPTCDFSHIFAIGEHEITSLPTTSALATKYGCAARVRRDDVVDTEPGLVYDPSQQNPGTKEWGLLPRPGRAEVYVYPNCRDGRVIADVVRIDKGHTEGLEPRVTEALIQLMRSARGGKLRQQG